MNDLADLTIIVERRHDSNASEVRDVITEEVSAKLKEWQDRGARIRITRALFRSLEEDKAWSAV
jgi:hypothetical protein